MRNTAQASNVAQRRLTRITEWAREQTALPGVFIPGLRLRNPLNGSHGSYFVNARERKEARARAFVHVNSKWRATIPLPAVVTFIRYGPGTMDDDNVRAACKGARDGVADALGVKDNDPRVTWDYDQQKSPPGCYGLRITIKPRQQP